MWRLVFEFKDKQATVACATLRAYADSDRILALHGVNLETLKIAHVFFKAELPGVGGRVRFLLSCDIERLVRCP